MKSTNGKGTVTKTSLDTTIFDLWNQIGEVVRGARVQESGTASTGYFFDPATLPTTGRNTAVPKEKDGTRYFGTVLLVGLELPKCQLSAEAKDTAVTAVTTAHALWASGNRQPQKLLARCIEGMPSFYPAPPNVDGRMVVADPGAVEASFHAAWAELKKIGAEGRGEVPSAVGPFVGVRAYINAPVFGLHEGQKRAVVFTPTGEVNGRPFDHVNCRQMLLRFGIGADGTPKIAWVLSRPAVWDAASRSVKRAAKIFGEGSSWPAVVMSRGIATAVSQAAWAACRGLVDVLNSSSSLLPLASLSDLDSADSSNIPDSELRGATVWQAASATRALLEACNATWAKEGQPRREPTPSDLAKKLRDLAQKNFAWVHREAFASLAVELEDTAQSTGDAVAPRWIARYLAARAGVTVAQAEAQMWQSVDAMTTFGLFAMINGRHGASAMLMQYGFDKLDQLLNIAMGYPPMADVDALTARNEVRADAEMLQALLTEPAESESAPTPAPVVSAGGLFGPAPAVPANATMQRRVGRSDEETRQIAKVAARAVPVSPQAAALLAELDAADERDAPLVVATQEEPEAPPASEEPAAPVATDDETANLLADITQETFGNAEESPAPDAPAEETTSAEKPARKRASRAEKATAATVSGGDDNDA